MALAGGWGTALALRRVMRSMVLLLVVAGCAEAEFGGGVGGGGKADELGPPVIELRDDWTVAQSAQLVAGEEVVIRYDLDRLTDCRTESGGQAVWGATGFAIVNGGAPESFAVGRLSGGAVVEEEARLTLPARASTLELFFQSSNTFGCRAWDSNFGANYVFPVSAAPSRPVSATLTFHPDGSVSQDGAVEGGTRVLVQYDPERLAGCAASQGGFPQWAVTGHSTVDGLQRTSFRAAEAAGGALVATDTLIDVGHGERLELWFEAHSATGCHLFDSNFGGNHGFDIE